MIISVLYNFSKPAVTAVSYPIRAGKFSNSQYPFLIGAGQFIPIHSSLEAVWSSPRGPHQSKWRENSLRKHGTLQVFCCHYVLPTNIHSHTKFRLFIFDSIRVITCLVKSVFFICHRWQKWTESCHKILFQSQSICDRNTSIGAKAYVNEALNQSNFLGGIFNFKMEGCW